MSEWLKTLPGYQTYAPGLEQKILRELPQIIVMGVLAIALPCVLSRLFLSRKAQQMIDILVFATQTFFLGMVMTIAFAALIIKLSKGPAYVADAYLLIDFDRPGK